MTGRNTPELLHGILAEIAKVSRLTDGYRYEDFYRDKKPMKASPAASGSSMKRCTRSRQSSG